jgi:DNA replication factor GINS
LDEFFQKLREIQKKERNLSGLAPVGENFYSDVFKYFNSLMRKIDDNPFSFESYLLRDAQRIIAEICERREHKISNSAVMNVQRSYQLFKDSKPSSKSPLKVPRNCTPEEEGLYQALVKSLVTHRENMRDSLRFYSAQNHINKKKFDNPAETIKKPIMNSSGELSHIKVDEKLNSDVGNIYKEFGKEPGQKPSSDYLASSKSIEDLTSSDDNNTDKNNFREITIKENQSLKNINNQKSPSEVLMILEELPTIMGVDKKIYGPFSPQDIITMPQPNAQILIKNRKGKFIQKL